MKPLLKFARIVKVDEVAHTVSGVVTSEAIDSENEIADYVGTKAAFQQWSAETLQKTTAAGQEPSLGNIRVMHQMEIGGKATELNFDDAAKVVSLVTVPANDEVWELCKGGFVTGFSLAGSYASVKDEKVGEKVVRRYVPVLTEVSYVDRPANPDANFTHVKADGSMAIQKFQKAKTKRVAGEDLPASAFAHVGDPDDTSTWKLPIKFSTDAKTKSHIRNAISRFDQTQGMSASEKEKAWKKIEAAAKEHGIEVNEEKAAAARVYKAIGAGLETATKRLQKGMYAVGSMADLIQSLAWMCQDSVYEAIGESDGSEVPGDLQACLDQLIAAFEKMVAEETGELKNQVASIKAGEANMKKLTTIEEAVKAAKSLMDHLKALKAHHEKMVDHHEKAAELHKAHAAMIEKAMGACGDMADGNEPGEKAAAVADPAAGGLTKVAIDAAVKAAVAEAMKGQPVNTARVTLVQRPGDPAPQKTDGNPLAGTGIE